MEICLLTASSRPPRQFASGVYCHIVVKQSSVDVNRINSSFQVYNSDYNVCIIWSEGKPVLSDSWLATMWNDSIFRDQLSLFFAIEN